MAFKDGKDEIEKFCVCRFEDCLSPIELVRRGNDDSLPKSCCDLEDCLERCLADDVLPSNSDPQPLPPLRYVARPDTIWLACRRPTVPNKETILGLLEDDTGQPRDVPIKMSVWTASTVTTPKDGTACRCRAPHRPWNRTSLVHVAERTPLSSEPNAETSVSGFAGQSKLIG
jgi:hypothetical protein